MAIALVLAAAAVSLAAGCGGDSGDDEAAAGSTGGQLVRTPGSGISKSQFISEADEICREGNQAINQAVGELPKGAGPDQYEAVATDTLASEAQAIIDGIEALGAPAGDEDEVDAILASAQEATDAIADDPSVMSDLSAPDPYEETNRLSKEYGLTNC
ncbi:MAG: hypothetical protein ACXW0P_11750 [Solirubrobacterales bacterium]